MLIFVTMIGLNMARQGGHTSIMDMHLEKNLKVAQRMSENPKTTPKEKR